jgi:hypothetical protein
MRTTSFVIAFIAISLLPIASSQAQVGCIGHRFSFKRDGITYVEGSTHAGQPCQIVFGIGGSDIEVVRTAVKPSHGVLGSSAKEGNRRYIAYAPSAGFVGHDRFEVYVQFTPLGGGSFATIVKVEMKVAP